MTDSSGGSPGQRKVRSGSSEPPYDCIIIGAGIGGLTAGWHLRDRNILLLESEGEVGGRVKSERRGDYWLSVGAHMFPEPESVVGRLVEDMRLETLVIRGDLLGVFINGRRVQGGRVELYPFRLPLERRARVELIKAGLKMRAAAAGYEKASKPRSDDTPTKARARLLSYLDDKSFRDYIGPLHPEVDSIFTTMSHRMTAEPDEVAAGCIAALFAHVWSSGDVVLGRNMRGGSAELPRALARELGRRVHTSAPASEVSSDPDGLTTVKYKEFGEARVARSRYVVVTSPSYVAREIVKGQSPELAQALSQIKYGPFVVGAFLTNERTAMPWDNVYSLLTPGLAFTMFFNHANVLRSTGLRQPGGAVMVYAGAGAGLRLIDKSDADIAGAFKRDLERLYPEMAGIVEDVWIQRWPNAQPFQRPGRSKLQQILEAPVGGRIFLAGDYVADWQQMESSASLAREVASRVRTGLQMTAAEESE